ncbi:MAG: response regulator [Elusimicrobia bacterium]|nr:response regulator [Elusimicrobiota bacterium]
MDQMEKEPTKAVLVVDDDPEFLLYARAALEGAGYPVTAAKSAGEAAKRLTDGRYAVVLTDLMLPGSSGLEVLEEARRREPLCVGIVMTGFATTDTALDALRQGAYDYLLKPCEPDALATAVRRGVDHYQLKVSLLHKTAQLEKLQNQLDEKSRMIQNVSHELKNPLSVVYGYAAFLLRQGPETAPEDMKRSLNSIYRNAERLGHLLEELMESTRLSNHKLELSREALPACRLCAETLENFRPEAARRGITLAFKCSCPEALVHADGKRVHQILSNLMSNAMKFTPAGGAITVTAVAEEGCVRFCVKDTGCGVPAEDLPRVFERFYQSEHTKHSHSGLGLGLEITKGLVELHGGRIWVESAPEKGAAFYFTLPLQVHSRPLPEPKRLKA